MWLGEESLAPPHLCELYWQITKHNDYSTKLRRSVTWPAINLQKPQQLKKTCHSNIQSTLFGKMLVFWNSTTAALPVDTNRLLGSLFQVPESHGHREIHACCPPTREEWRYELSVLRSGLRAPAGWAHSLTFSYEYLRLCLCPETSQHPNSLWVSRDKVFVTRTNLELEATFLPPPPECWDHRHVPMLTSSIH